MSNINRNRIVISLLFILYAIFLPSIYKIFDFEFWKDWLIHIHRNGILAVYEHPTAIYHPPIMYILALFDWVQGSEYAIVQNINYLKLFILPFDFLPIVALCCFRQKIISQRIPYLLLLLNIAYVFNTIYWGQMDALHISFIFLSVACAFSYPVASSILCALAITTKPQAIIFLPVVSIVWIYSVRNWTGWLRVVISFFTVLFIVFLPFILTGNLGMIFHKILSAVGKYPYVSVCAYNIWYLIARTNPEHTVHNEVFWIFSYQAWGFALFFSSSVLVLLPLALRSFRYKFSKQVFNEDIKQMAFLAAGLITLLCYYFNVEMHERYAQPIIIFFFFYGVISKNYKLYVLASIPYVLSLAKYVPEYVPSITPKIIWASKILAIWFSATLVYGCYEYFRQYKIRREWVLLKNAWRERRLTR